MLKQIHTKLVLRTRTEAEWLSSDYVPLKGEACLIELSNGNYNLKFGNGQQLISAITADNIIYPFQLSGFKYYDYQLSVSSLDPTIFSLVGKTVDTNEWKKIGNNISIDFSQLYDNILFLSSEISTIKSTDIPKLNEKINNNKNNITKLSNQVSAYTNDWKDTVDYCINELDAKSKILSNSIYSVLSDYTTSSIVSNITEDYLKDYYKKSETSSNIELENKFTNVNNSLSAYGKTIEYVSLDRKLYLKNDESILGTVDCNDFIKDGMLSSVELCGNVLILKFNTDQGTAPISINLSAFVDVYTAGNGLCCNNNIFYINENIVAIKDDLTSYYLKTQTSSNAELNDKFNTLSTYSQIKDQLSNDNYLTAHQSLSDYYTKIETSSSTELSIALKDIPIIHKFGSSMSAGYLWEIYQEPSNPILNFDISTLEAKRDQSGKLDRISLSTNCEYSSLNQLAFSNNAGWITDCTIGAYPNLSTVQVILKDAFNNGEYLILTIKDSEYIHAEYTANLISTGSISSDRIFSLSVTDAIFDDGEGSDSYIPTNRAIIRNTNNLYDYIDENDSSLKTYVNEKNAQINKKIDQQDNLITSWVNTNFIDNARVIEYPNDTSALVESSGIKSFVNSSIQNVAAFYITKSDGNPFDTYTQLSNTTSSDMYCGGKQWTPRRNNYCIVREDDSQIERCGHWSVNATITGSGTYTTQYQLDSQTANQIKWKQKFNRIYQLPYTIVYSKTAPLNNIQFEDAGGGNTWKDCGILSGLKPENGDNLGSFHWVSPNGSTYDFSFTPQGANQLPTARYIYNPGTTSESAEYAPSCWQFQYNINNTTFTQAQLCAINSGITSSKVAKLDELPTKDDLDEEFATKLDITADYTTSTEVSSIAEGYVPKTLSSINNNEIQNYVRNDDETIKIGLSSEAYSYGIAIGRKAKNYGQESIAIGRNAKIDNYANYSCQIGQGTNNEVSSLQFLNTTVVNSSGVIPNKSLELNSINGILSGDGNGNIVSANIEIDHLSSIENNEISNYVRNDEYSIKIGKGSSASGGGNIVVGSGTAKANGVNAIAIGKDSNSARNYSVSIGSSSQAAGVNSVAIGSSAIVKSNINYACQIGQGTNNQVSSLQFLNTTVVNLSGVIPNKSLELSSVNGILSSDGAGNIVSANIDFTETDPEFNKWLSSAPVKIGLQTTASGPNSVAIGIESAAQGKSSIAIGHFARVGAEHAVQIGKCLSANDTPNSFKFRDIYIVKDGKIPNESLALSKCELKFVFEDESEPRTISVAYFE